MEIKLYSDMLKKHAEEIPDKIAVIGADAVYTYAELNKASNRFANALKKKGVKPGDFVMVSLPKDSTTFVSMFGIMKSGAVIVPVNLDYPEGRINKIKADCKPVMWIDAPGDDGRVSFYELMKEEDDSEPETLITGADPCMLLYTSGSTGNPKGVLMRHQGYVTTGLPYEDNLLAYNTKKYGHVFLGVTTATFAFFYMEYCFCLSNGCTYIMADLEHSRSPMLMAELIKEYNVDVVSGTPSRIMQYLDIPVYAEAFSNAHILVIGGERVPDGMPEDVHRVAPDCHILNGYSQTEANGPVIVAEVETAASLGKAGHGWKLMVVDDSDNETKDGEQGELLLSGDNIMAGYLNLPEETAAKKLMIAGTEYFRTGDYVIREAGGYRIVGRMDQQIKLRGLRMEPGEIEKIIQSFPDIRIEKAVVKVNVIHNTEHLVAYYTGDGEADEAALRKHLAYELPQYMIPDFFMYLEQFTLNQNGKIDYKLLPAIEIQDLEIVPPKDELERGLLAECMRIVEFDEFGVTTPLDEVGFTSLTYIELASTILDNSHVELRLTDLMAGGATVRSLADIIRNAEGLDVQKAVRRDKYPLTPQLYQFTAKNPVADMYRRLVFNEKYNDAAEVREAVVRVLNAFPYIYTTFRKEGDEWYQIPGNGKFLKAKDFEIVKGEPTEEDIKSFCVPYDLETADRLFDLKFYQGEKVTLLMHIQHVLMDHVYVEKLIDYFRTALKDRTFVPRERMDYYDYTMDVAESAGENEAAADKKQQALYEAFPDAKKDAPSYAQAAESLHGGVPLAKIRPVADKYKVQTADYVFGLFTQAYLEVMGKDAAVFANIFGGRNDARYFHTMGFFPTRILIPVKKDERFYEHIADDIVSAFEKGVPQDDLSYRILEKKDYTYPNISYNCMAYIEENDDFSLESLFAENAQMDDRAKMTNPQIDMMCLIVGTTAAACVLNYDPEFISKEKAQEILDKMTEIADKAVQ
ncbi:MAG: AMP-binding protein [Lachnospiraceae bacterium]|nr:AMP-binding protein [Lachnospiraceae bacterium]